MTSNTLLFPTVFVFFSDDLAPSSENEKGSNILTKAIKDLSIMTKFTYNKLLYYITKVTFLYLSQHLHSVVRDVNFAEIYF